MPGIYHPRHPERTALYLVPFHKFDRFLSEYEKRFEKEHGYFRPIVKEVVEKVAESLFRGRQKDANGPKDREIREAAIQPLIN